MIIINKKSIILITLFVFLTITTIPYTNKINKTNVNVDYSNSISLTADNETGDTSMEMDISALWDEIYASITANPMFIAIVIIFLILLILGVLLVILKIRKEYNEGNYYGSRTKKVK